MTRDSGTPELRRNGQSALAEVLRNLLSLPATPCDPTSEDVPPDPITSRVLLTGPELSGTVILRLPRAFVLLAVRRLTGLDGAAAEANGLLDDTAGELANMVAGRVAAQLASHGHRCTLSTPSVSRSAALPIEILPGADRGCADLLCDGHRLSLVVQCRYGVP